MLLSFLLLGISAAGMNNSDNQKQRNLNRQLFGAVEVGSFADVAELIEQGAQVDARGLVRATPLMDAAMHGYTNICRLLIENQASVNAKDAHEWTPLYHGISGNANTCKLLIEHKALPDAKAFNGRTPLADAFGTDICELLIGAQLEQARKDKALIITFLTIARKGYTQLLSQIPYDVIRMIAQEALKDVRLEKQHVVDQIRMMDKERQDRWLEYVNEQMNTPIKEIT